MDTYTMEFDMRREEAESRMVSGSGLPDEFASAFRMRNAALTRNGKSLALANIRTKLAFPEVSS